MGRAQENESSCWLRNSGMTSRRRRFQGCFPHIQIPAVCPNYSFGFYSSNFFIFFFFPTTSVSISYVLSNLQTDDRIPQNFRLKECVGKF